MKEWVFLGNEQFDSIRELNEVGKTLWQRFPEVQEKDIVYIYVTRDIKAIRFKCEVSRIFNQNQEQVMQIVCLKN